MQAHPEARQLTVLCSVSEPAHASYPGTVLGEHAYGQFASMLQQVQIYETHSVEQVSLSTRVYLWDSTGQAIVDVPAQDLARARSETMPRSTNPAEQQQQPPAVTVRHFPLPPCAITSSGFVLPAASFAASAPRCAAKSSSGSCARGHMAL